MKACNTRHEAGHPLAATRSSALRERRREAGFSYVEVVIATLLIAIALVPAIDALQNGMRSAGVNVDMAEEHFHMASLLEEVLAQPFAALDAEAVSVGDPTVPTSYSDAMGAARRRLVFLARYDADDADADADGFTGGDDGLLWVKVQLENSHRAVETLTAR